MVQENNYELAERVLNLVAKKIGVPVERVRPQDRLLHDLSLYGDDAEELVIEFSLEFGLDPSRLNLRQYFFPEGFAYGLMPSFLRRRFLATKRSLTVADLIQSASTGKWP